MKRRSLIVLLLALLTVLFLFTVALAQARTGAVCKDKTTTTVTGSGACSHHGGVDHWITSDLASTATPTMTPSSKATAKPTATAKLFRLSKKKLKRKSLIFCKRLSRQESEAKSKQFFHAVEL